MNRMRISLDNSGFAPADADRMSVDIFRPRVHASSRIAFVFHGRNGASASPHLLKMIEPYLNRNYLVVSPNNCNSDWNNSAGIGKDFLIASHVRDCARTIEWAKASRHLLGWKGNDIALCGHSMGGYAASFLAATTYNDCTRHVLAVAPFTDGHRQIEARADTRNHPNGIAALELECPAALAEWPEHSVYSIVEKLRMPVSAVVGADDTLTLPRYITDFFKALPNGVDLMVLEGEHHCLIGDNVPSILGQCIARLETRADPRPEHTLWPWPRPL